jgi:outer membrane protein OmpA-like peptidoglycan-associated protein
MALRYSLREGRLAITPYVGSIIPSHNYEYYAHAAPGRRIETLTGPSFAFNKATLTPEGRQHVDHAVEILRDNPNIAVSVEGHTDSVGSDAYNMKLSQRRADAVRDYMVAHGIAADRITTEAFGETRPVASNDTAAGRAENRRVEIIAR